VANTENSILIQAGWTAIVASEAGFFNVLVQYWSEGAVPLAATGKSRLPELR
jgi:hypothetical protein